ncbi:MAG: MATE family efflux transporter [Betaproteobacteria bacterium]|nr:MATE family efflux transporter [Betaproteobacteria bacterium]
MPLTLPTTPRDIGQRLWQLGGPVALQALLASTLGLIDTLMVNSLGPAALAGVGLVGRMMFVLTMVLAGLSSAAGVLVAQYSGGGRRHATRGPVVAATLLGLALTLPMTAAALLAATPISRQLSDDPAVIEKAAQFLTWSAAYAPLTAITMMLATALRSTGNTRAPLWAGLVALGINSLLNILFINGNFGFPAFGVAAAAVATTCARLIEIAWLLNILRPGPLLRLPRSIRKKDTRNIIRGAAPLMAKEIAWAGGIMVSTLIISRMGALPLAALNLIQPIEGIMISVVYGCGVATGILIGQALGRGEFDKAYQSANRILRLIAWNALLVGFFVALLVEIIRRHEWLTGLITPELHDPALFSLSIICIAFGAKAHNTIISVGILRSGNDTPWLLGVDLCSMWLINLPLVYCAALVLHWPLPAVVGVLMLEEILKVGVFHWRVRSGRWLRRL